LKKLKRQLRQSPLVRWPWSFAKAYSGFLPRISRMNGEVPHFMQSYQQYMRANDNPNFAIGAEYLYPCLEDRSDTTPIEPTYFLQNAWAARRIFEIKPERHVDVGSAATAIAIIAQHTPITMVDIRPIDIELDGLTFVEGTIVDLPFETGSLESVSSICVIEHIGLGRYGDPIDPWGSEKAAKELVRVIRPGGHVLISLPIDSACRVYFNAHRSFTPDYVRSIFDGCDIVDEQYIYGRALLPSYDPNLGFGTGLYHFVKK
jgi:SAM-dependent methyltransferase